jgi:opacity protein-like surface antigen
MKKILICTGLLCGAMFSTWAQDVGLSFSYFIPRNGDFSTPISPFSIRGLGFNLNRFIAIETGASLYRMSGMGMIDLPFESKNSLIGPNFTILVPVELVFQLKGQQVEFDIKGGGFFFYGFDQHLNNGNIDRALRQYQSWDVLNSNLSYENNPGFGYHFGAELTIPVTGQVSVSLETNYLMGTAKFPLKGSYSGGTLNGTNQTVAVDYKDAKIDFTGLEFSIGLIFSSGGGGRAKAKKRR